MLALKDDSPMPFGKHYGTQMADVPAAWLRWFYMQNVGQKINGSHQLTVFHYIEENLDVLKEEYKEKTGKDW